MFGRFAHRFAVWKKTQSVTCSAGAPVSHPMPCERCAKRSKPNGATFQKCNITRSMLKGRIVQECMAVKGQIQGAAPLRCPGANRSILNGRIVQC